MKILLSYTSKTNNTKIFAEKIYEIIPPEHKVLLHNISSADKINLDNFDLHIVGTWIDKGSAVKTVSKFMSNIKDKKIIIFGTIGAMPNSEHGLKSIENLKNIPDKSNTLLDVILLPGIVDKKLIKMMNLIPSFIVSKEIKDKMIVTAKNSRNPRENEYIEALERIKKLI